MVNVSRSSLEGVRNVLTLQGKVNGPGLSVSEISRELDDLSRHTIYGCLERLGAVRDDSFYPPVYTLPADDEVRPTLTRELVEGILADFERTPDFDVKWAADRILAGL